MTALRKRSVALSPQRARLMNGMLETVGAQGYKAALIATVLHRTGISWPTFLDHFPDKRTCYLEAFDTTVAEIQDSAIASANQQGSWCAKLQAGLAVVLTFLDSKPEVGRALVVEAGVAGAAAIARRDRALEAVTDFIQTARLDPQSLPSPPGIAAAGIAGSMFSVVHRRLSRKSGDSLTQLLPELTYLAALPYFGVDEANVARKHPKGSPGGDLAAPPGPGIQPDLLIETTGTVIDVTASFI